MGLMEFLDQNLVNTTTQMTVPASNTGTAAYLVNRNVGLGFTSVGYTTSTTLTIGFTFSPAVNVSHILLQNHNVRDGYFRYNSLAANTLATLALNSASTTYFSFATVTGINSIDFVMSLSTVADTEKRLGEIVITTRRLQFDRNPSVDDWWPETARKQIVHEMPDGGAKVYNIRDKFRAKLRWSFITQAFHDSLLAVYDRALPQYFVPFPTTAAGGWSGAAYEVVWLGTFNFKHGDNAKVSGFIGDVDLKQTAGG